MSSGPYPKTPRLAYPKPDGWQGGGDDFTFMQQGNARPTDDETYEHWMERRPDCYSIDFSNGEEC